MRRSLLGGPAVVAAMAAACVAPGLTPVAAAAARPPAGAVAPVPARLLAPGRPLAAVDFTALHAEALQVLTRNYQAGVDQATAALTAASGEAQSDAATLTDDQAAATAATAHAANAAQTLATTTSAHTAAVTAHATAVATLATDRDRLAQVGIAMYMGPPPEVPDVSADLSAAEASADGSLYLSTGGRELSGDIDADERTEAATAATERRLAQQVEADQLSLTQSDGAQQQAEAAVTGDQATLAAAQQAAALAKAGVTGAQTRMTAAVSAFGAPAADGSPTILGPPAMVPSQLAAWFTSSSSYADQTTATPAQLAAWYISEGAAEGVRGDVAFAQAIVETGGFSSPDAINLNNYAGVGHCDSCASGLAFPSPQGGVRGQVQLLRIFASPSGTPLTQPPIIPQVAPGGQFRGACCPSWQSLTGTWATDPQYGQVVLTVYQRILDFALSQPPVVPGSQAAGDDPTAPAAKPTGNVPAG